ncbi:MAG TPA: hypothetical protein VJN92_22865 [Candidatus Acidoferrum sp.]|nr:hypothetical protein [Candidatus Acidoferrum sp.]
MGRPPKPKAKKKGKRLELRLTVMELRKMMEKARKAGLSVSEFLRQQAKD